MVVPAFIVSLSKLDQRQAKCKVIILPPHQVPDDSLSGRVKPPPDGNCFTGPE